MLAQFSKSLPRYALFGAIYSGFGILAFWFAYEIRFGGSSLLTASDPNIVNGFLDQQRPGALLWVLLLKLVLLALAGQFRGVFYFFRLYEAVRMALALMVATAVMLVLPSLVGPVHPQSIWSLPHSLVLVDFNLSLIFFIGGRVVIRAWRERFAHRGKPRTVVLERIAIVGAGQAGEQLTSDLFARRGHGLEPVCFLDDDESKHGLEIHGLPVIGSPDLIPQLAEKYQVTEVILALPVSRAKRVHELTTLATAHGLRVLAVPTMADLAGGRIRVTDLRPVSVEDLLGRTPAKLDDQAIDHMIRGRTVLVTGAGGSIGQELSRQIGSRLPSRLILVDQCEGLLYQTEQELIALGVGSLITPLVADIKDAGRMRQIFTELKPSLVLHAAAHKHVPLMESQPTEALKNNTQGTALLAELASEFKCEKFVLISSDKAVNPTNVMGASKRLAELVIQGMQTRPGNETQFMAVRFGNVLGSSGSVIPLFRKQIAAGGPVTVTHPEMKRYFMTIPEAVGLVLQSATQGKGGDILVLEMGQPLKILDVARQLIELSGFRPDADIEIKITGLRPGEKLVEELQHTGEQYHPTSHPRILRFLGAPPAYAQMQGMLTKVAVLLTLERNPCKQGLRELVPEYTPFLD